MTLPFGDFTPFGYLRNPSARATGWGQHQGGVLRTCDERVGMEWCYPTANVPTLRLAVWLVALLSGGARCETRRDFEAIGYVCRYHTANMLELDWRVDEVEVSARYFLDGDTLCLRLRAANQAAAPRPAFWQVVIEGEGAQRVDVAGDVVMLTSPPETMAPPVHVAGPCGTPWKATAEGARATVGTERLGPGAVLEVALALARGNVAAEVAERAERAADRAPSQLEVLLDEDRRFHATAPRLTGDWPPSWANGLHYDLETTRMCVFPAGGIFRDVWPSWMVAWPRVVLAEGALDMLRLAYADPQTAARAVLSLFRDAPAPNVPCVFEGGEPNMVARDGSICGTSPAWCLPFLCLERLYLRTLDRAWLAELLPYLEAYLDWWLAHRSDRDGFLVYRCTWEAGEDGNPRLDQGGSGDAVISDHVRPVELQAAMALSAERLAWLAGEVDEAAISARWAAVHQDFVRRTQTLWDPAESRFRDWLIQDGRFQDPDPDERYWGVDSRRWGALSLVGLFAADDAQKRLMQEEVRRHGNGPWTWWPSWTFALAEAAALTGQHEWLGEQAFSILDRVYRQNDRRTLADFPRPTPGAAREYWPRDLRDWRAGDGYGWGAETADLLLRHMVGFGESREAGLTFTLTPALPEALRIPGRQYGVRNVLYRSTVFDLSYTVSRDSSMLVGAIELRAPAACGVVGPNTPLYQGGCARRHHFPLRNGVRYGVRIE
ncbi:MAG: hypothetical protein HYX52_08985 [Chloroflexi bacterium]|nr:hypothetical protein [Chloroflexota bacterium]